MKRLQGALIGFLAAVLILTNIQVFADNIEAAFNSINISVNGSRVANIGDSYTLSNGDIVPFSILYRGTAYLPMRKLGELLGKDVGWDDNSKIASINDKPASSPIISPSPSPSPSLSPLPTPTPTAQPDLSVSEIAKKSDAVVLIKTYDANKKLQGTGSGFITSSDGIIVTNYHVIDGALYIDIVLDDNKVLTLNTILGYDKARDIAILKLDGVSNMPFIALGDSSDIEVGQPIVAIGSPMGLRNVVSDGIIGNIRSNIREVPNSYDILISAPISPGSSGGALFNMDGEVIGITFAYIVGGQNLNFAIPINELKTIDISKQYTIKAVYDIEHSSAQNPAVEYIYEKEPNNNMNTANDLPLDIIGLGYMSSSNDADVYTITISQPGYYNIISQISEYGAYCENYRVVLYDSNNKILASAPLMRNTLTGEYCRFLYNYYITSGTYYIWIIPASSFNSKMTSMQYGILITANN